MSKVLFRDVFDETLYCLEVSEVSYDPKEDSLHFQGYGEKNFGEAIFHGLGKSKAEELIRIYHKSNKLDLSASPAEINPDRALPFQTPRH